jgi:DNA excision repair protein ERCC-1
LVANFGSLRNAVNADAESLGMISGWGGTKVKRWTKAMEEPFRVKKAARRGLTRGESTADGDNRTETLRNAVPLSRVPLREMSSLGTPGQSSRGSPTKGSTPRPMDVAQGMHDIDDRDEEAMLAAAIEESKRTAQPGQVDDREQRQSSDPGATSQQESQSQGLSDGVAAALAKLRENGS